MSAKLFLRSLFSSLDWEMELEVAASETKWNDFIFCLNRRPELAKRKMVFQGWPLLKATESGNLTLIKQIVELGADINAEDTPTDISSLHGLIPVNVLVKSWSMGHKQMYEWFFKRVSAVTKFRAFQHALFANDPEWLNTFDFASCISGVESEFAAASKDIHPDVPAWARDDHFLLQPPPIVVALYGECSLSIVEKIWAASSEKMRTIYYVESPGFGHDNDPVYGGYLDYWAARLQRNDVLEFLLQQRRWPDSESGKFKILLVDRSSTWSIEQISSISKDRVKPIWENPAVTELTEIDLEKVELLPLVPGGFIPESLTQEEFNQNIIKRLKTYTDQGYLLLDGTVVVAMLNQKWKIPSLWGQMTESEAMDEISATIRFDGSIFSLRENSGEFILTPFASRGLWSFGYGNRFPQLSSKEERNRFYMSREVTAAIKL